MKVSTKFVDLSSGEMLEANGGSNDVDLKTVAKITVNVIRYVIIPKMLSPFR